MYNMLIMAAFVTDTKNRLSSGISENRRLSFELLAGLEPATHALRMRCATNCATEAK